MVGGEHSARHEECFSVDGCKASSSHAPSAPSYCLGGLIALACTQHRVPVLSTIPSSFSILLLCTYAGSSKGYLPSGGWQEDPCLLRPLSRSNLTILRYLTGDDFLPPQSRALVMGGMGLEPLLQHWLCTAYRAVVWGAPYCQASAHCMAGAMQCVGWTRAVRVGDMQPRETL